MGKRKQAKGKVGRRQRRQATLWAPATQVQPVPLSARARGCKGRSPLHENNLNIPLPRRGRALCERGRGDGGKKASQRQGWQATNRASHPLGTANTRRPGDLPGKPPFGYRQHPPPRRPAGQATHRAPPTPAAPATCRANYPSGTCLAGSVSAVSGSVQGCRGRSPRRNKLWDSPFPGGEGGRGDGGSKASQRQGWWATKKANHPLGTANAHRPGDLPGKPPLGHLLGRDYKCRRRFSAEVPGASPPAK